MTGEPAGSAFELYTQIIDGAAFGCWYRLLKTGEVEVLARGARVVLPIEAIALLPEPIARAVLSKLAIATTAKLEAAVHAANQIKGTAEPS